jgi:hypothetical protein
MLTFHDSEYAAPTRCSRGTSKSIVCNYTQDVSLVTMQHVKRSTNGLIAQLVRAYG